MVLDVWRAAGIDAMALNGDAALVRERKLTAEQARRFAAEIRKLPPITRMAGQVAWGERLSYLDCVSAASHEGVSEFEGLVLMPQKPEGKLASFADRLFTAVVDWNETMRAVNRGHDRIACALSKPTRKEREAAVADLRRDLTLTTDFTNFRALGRNIGAAGSLRGGLGRHVGNVVAAWFLWGLSVYRRAEEETIAAQNLILVAFALAAYRADRGEYPADLAALVPKYIPAVPEDTFADGPLHYRREGPGYVLYSVGPNGIDDGGRSRWDEPDAEDAAHCDDIAIRVPAREKNP